MTTYVDHLPKGVFRTFDSSVTLAEVADELAHGHAVCVRNCSARDVTRLELLAEPHGFDLLLVPAVNASVLEVYFRRRAPFQRGACTGEEARPSKCSSRFTPLAPHLPEPRSGEERRRPRM